MSHRHGPVYELKNCIDCAAAFIRSARPDRKRQDNFIEFLVVHRGWEKSLLMNYLQNGTAANATR